MTEIFSLLLLIAIIAIFFYPTYRAVEIEHPAKNAIIITNLVGGLIYGIGWLIALIWVFNGAEKVKLKADSQKKVSEELKKPSISEEIRKLHELKEENIISEEEFIRQKNELLNS